MSDKSYVGVGQCFWCGGDKEVILDRRMKDTLPRKAVYNKEPCDSCKEWMEKGVILISVDPDKTTEPNNPYRSGGWIVLREEAVNNIFDSKQAKAMREQRVGFVEDEAWDAIGLPRGEIKTDEDN